MYSQRHLQVFQYMFQRLLQLHKQVLLQLPKV
jgi:hypothetical protein